MTVVRNVDLTVNEGEIVALLGPNGAGKSTTLLTLAGHLPSLGGDIDFAGLRPSAAPYKRAREGLMFVPEQRAIFPSLSAAANLSLGRGGVAGATALFPELTPLLSRRAGLLSGGEQQILCLARALAAKPRLLLTDELSLGLAPQVVDRLHQELRHAARAGGIAVLLVEQHTHLALELADRAYVMQRGQIVAHGNATELQHRLPEIQQAYLSAESVLRLGE
jgi:branched-chain amino acid transport system ATP-binding protein